MPSGYRCSSSARNWAIRRGYLAADTLTGYADFRPDEFPSPDREVPFPRTCAMASRRSSSGAARRASVVMRSWGTPRARRGWISSFAVLAPLHRRGRKQSGSALLGLG